MIVTCLGHSKFLIELASGYRLVTDPFDASVGYPVQPLKADAALVSHYHHDHDAVDTVEAAKVLDKAGDWQLTDVCHVRALPSWHDDAQGTKRGPNLIFSIRAEGLHLVHLGDNGHVPDQQLAEQIGPADLLMVPVGGHFTINASQAREICEQLNARVILPMHYRTEVNAGWPIAPVEEFLSLFPEKAETLPLLRVTQEDLGCQPHLALLQGWSKV